MWEARPPQVTAWVLKDWRAWLHEHVGGGWGKGLTAPDHIWVPSIESRISRWFVVMVMVII